MHKLYCLLVVFLLLNISESKAQGNSLNLNVSDFCGVEFGDAVVKQRIVSFFGGDTPGSDESRPKIRMNSMGYTNRDNIIRPVVEAWNRNDGVTRNVVIVRDGQIVSPKLRLAPGTRTHLEVSDIVPAGSTTNYQYRAYTYTENAGVITPDTNIGTAAANFTLSAQVTSEYGWSLETNLTIQVEASDLLNNTSSNAAIQSVTTTDPNVVVAFEIIDGRAEIQLDCEYLETVPESRLEDFSLDFVVTDQVTNPDTGVSETVTTSGSSSVQLSGFASGYELTANFTGRNYAVALAGNPVTSSTISGLMSTWNYAFASYDETVAGPRNNGFSAFTSKVAELSSGTFASTTVGKGYFLGILDPTKSDEYVSNEYPKVFHVPGSTQQTGTFSYNSLISFTNTAAADIEDGWNLVANPTKKILFADLDDVAKWPTVSNIDKTVYILDPSDNQYKAYNSLAGTNGFTGQILPYQAFWVKANAAAPQLITDIDQSLIDLPVNSPKKKAHPVLTLQFKREGALKDESVVVLHRDAIVDKDPFDAIKMVATSLPTPLIWLNNENLNYAIQALPLYGTEHIIYDLIITDSLASNHTITLESSFNFTNYWVVELVDRYTNTSSVLNSNTYLDVDVFPNIITTSKAKVDDNGPYFKMAASSELSRYALKLSPNTSTSIETTVDKPTDFNLSQNYPNPFNPSTIINYQVPQASSLVFSIYNSLGQLMQHTDLGLKSAGTYSFSVDAFSWPAGLYLYRLQSDNGFVSTKKMMLLK